MQKKKKRKKRIILVLISLLHFFPNKSDSEDLQSKKKIKKNRLYLNFLISSIRKRVSIEFKLYGGDWEAARVWGGGG